MWKRALGSSACLCSSLGTWSRLEQAALCKGLSLVLHFDLLVCFLFSVVRGTWWGFLAFLSPNSFSVLTAVGILEGRLASQMPKMGIHTTPMTSVTQRRKCLKVSEPTYWWKRLFLWLLDFSSCSVHFIFLWTPVCLAPCLGPTSKRFVPRELQGKLWKKLCYIIYTSLMNCAVLFHLV